MDNQISMKEHQVDAQTSVWGDLLGEGAKGALNLVESAASKAARSTATFLDCLSSLPAELKPGSGPQSSIPGFRLPESVCRPSNGTGAPGAMGNGEFSLPAAVCRPVDRTGSVPPKLLDNEFTLPPAVCRPMDGSGVPAMNGIDFVLPPAFCKPAAGTKVERNNPLGGRGEASSPAARPAAPTGEQSLPPARPGEQTLPPAKPGDGSDKLPPVGRPGQEADSILEKAMVNYIAKALESGYFGEDAQKGLEQVFRASPTTGRKLVQKINEHLAQSGEFKIELIEGPTNATDKQKAPEWDVVLKDGSKTSDKFHLVGKCP